MDEAIGLAQDAALLAAATSDPNTIADGLVDLALVLQQAHSTQEAAAAAAEALKNYEAKGNLVGAARARAAQGPG